MRASAIRMSENFTRCGKITHERVNSTNALSVLQPLNLLAKIFDGLDEALGEWNMRFPFQNCFCLDDVRFALFGISRRQREQPREKNKSGFQPLPNPPRCIQRSLCSGDQLLNNLAKDIP